jgi:hypothetical protein
MLKAESKRVGPPRYLSLQIWLPAGNADRHLRPSTEAHVLPAQEEGRGKLGNHTGWPQDKLLLLRLQVASRGPS